MFAIGRHPNVARLGLDKAGVTTNPNNGGIAVDGFSRTSAPHIYAIGDVTHRINLTPVAIREGHAFADTVFGKRSVQVDHADIPTAVFSQPEVCTVALTETQARAQFSHVDIYKADGFKLLSRIFIDGMPSHLTFDNDSKTVFVTLQQSNRVVAFQKTPVPV